MPRLRRRGNRTDRTKARLKYVLDDWGFTKFLDAVEEKLAWKLTRVDAAHVNPRHPYDRKAHIGVHAQKQPGLNWIGVVLPVGKMMADQMRSLAGVARDLGDGDIRLTVWQNLLISGIADANIEEAKCRVAAAGLDWKATPVRAGLVACTGNRGCKFALSDTKGHGAAIVDHIETRTRPSISRSISISPAARIPVRSTISAISACSRQRYRPIIVTMPTKLKAITSTSAAGSAAMQKSRG